VNTAVTVDNRRMTFSLGSSRQARSIVPQAELAEMDSLW
jgi:hypothetical protein